MAAEKRKWFGPLPFFLTARYFTKFREAAPCFWCQAFQRCDNIGAVRYRLLPDVNAGCIEKIPSTVWMIFENGLSNSVKVQVPRCTVIPEIQIWWLPNRKYGQLCLNLCDSSDVHVPRLSTAQHDLHSTGTTAGISLIACYAVKYIKELPVADNHSYSQHKATSVSA